MNIAGVILAAGLSRRMGASNKLLLSVNTQPLYQHICEALKNLRIKIIVTSYDEISDYGQRNNFTVIKNQHQELGQSYSIKLALNELTAIKNVDGILFATADQPYINEHIISKLTNEFANCGGNKIIVPQCNSTPYSPCIFPVKYAEELTKLEGDKGGRAVYRKYLEDVQFVEFPSDNFFLDIDTPEDFRKLTQL